MSDTLVFDSGLTVAEAAARLSSIVESEGGVISQAGNEVRFVIAREWTELDHGYRLEVALHAMPTGCQAVIVSKASRVQAIGLPIIAVVTLSLVYQSAWALWLVPLAAAGLVWQGYEFVSNYRDKVLRLRSALSRALAA